MLGQNPYAEEATQSSLLWHVIRRHDTHLCSDWIRAELSGGLTDKVEFNEQPERNAGYTEESIKSNTMSAVPQAQANSIRGLRKQQVDISQQEYEAQQLLARRKAEVLLR